MKQQYVAAQGPYGTGIIVNGNEWVVTDDCSPDNAFWDGEEYSFEKAIEAAKLCYQRVTGRWIDGDDRVHEEGECS